MLLITVFVAILAAFFASTYPDGLDFVAEKFGFAKKGVERTAPLNGLSTSTAGIAGVLIMLSLFWGSAYVIKKGAIK
jgi:hypothetical protein